MFKLFLETLPEQHHLRVKYITVTFWLCAVFSSLFQFQYFFIYKYYDFNWILWPLYLWSLATPLFARITKNYELTAYSLLLSSSLEAVVLIYCAGAIQAPGVFWLSVFPVSGGILLGRKGAIAGTILVIVTTIFYFIAQYNWDVPNIVKLMDNYEQQRVINFVTFFIFSVWLIFYFLSYESRSQAEIRKHKLEMESLLHILIHDVAGPLGVIEMDVFKLKKQPVAADTEKSLERIERNINSVSSLLKHIKEMKALRDGKIELANHAVDFCKTLQMSLENLTDRIQEKNIQIKNQCSYKNCFIKGDEALLQNIVLNNLLVNAIKFSPFGGEIVLKGSSDENFVYLEIQDQGIGIPEYILKNIFSLTYRTSRPGTNGERGTGYGMLLVKEYVEKMKGEIKIISNEAGSGSGPSGTLVTLKFSKFDN